MSALISIFNRNSSELLCNGNHFIDNYWSVEAQVRTIKITTESSEKGILLSAPAESKNIFLRRNLPIPIELDEGKINLTLIIEAHNRERFKSILGEVNILRKMDGEGRSLIARFSAFLFREVGLSGLRLDAALSWPHQAGEHVVEIRLRAGRKRTAISQIAIEVTSLPAAKAPTAAERRPEVGYGLATEQLRAAVVTWQVNSNPFGRAYVLADMIARRHGAEIIGPTFAPPGQGIWKPLSDTKLPVRFFEGGRMETFLPAAQAMALAVNCDVVHVSKARLPGMLIAMLIKHRNGCPVVLDLDDHEPSLFGPGPSMPTPDLEQLEIGLDKQPDVDKPQGQFWTQVAEKLIPSFEDRTVVNRSLMDRYGGIIVRHGRDEDVFHPDPALRARMRASMHLTEDHRVILFAGTARRHKGLDRLIDALERLADPRLLLIVAGTQLDISLHRELKALGKSRVRFLPDIAFSELPSLMQVADGVCLLQVADSPISAYQTPAKLSDALAMGIPVAITPVPPVADLLQPGIVSAIDDDARLDAWLRSVAETQHPSMARFDRLHLFDAEISYKVNLARIERSFARALERPMSWPAEWTRLFRILNRHFGARLPEAPPAWA